MDPVPVLATSPPPAVPATALAFTRAARALADAAHRHGWRAPGFRTPPAGRAGRRSLRRYADGSAMVAVAVRGRDLVAVIDDMVDGVVATNGWRGPAAARARCALWEAVEDLVAPATETAHAPTAAVAAVAAVAA